VQSELICSVFNAGIQGCISVAANGDGEPVFIHDCNTQKDLKNQDWETTWAVRGDTAPGPITIFGNKVRLLEMFLCLNLTPTQL
jgi:hypothetical protein